MRALPRKSEELEVLLMRIKATDARGTVLTGRAPAKERSKEGEERKEKNKVITPSTGPAVSLPQTILGATDPNTRLVNLEPPIRCGNTCPNPKKG